MAQNTPWRLKNSNIFWGGPPDPPGGGAPPSHLALHAKMAAVTPSLVPAINTFVPGTSNLNKNPETADGHSQTINWRVEFGRQAKEQKQ